MSNKIGTKGNRSLKRQESCVYCNVNEGWFPTIISSVTDYEDGFVVVNAAEGRIKHKNVLNDTE